VLKWGDLERKETQEFSQGGRGHRGESGHNDESFGVFLKEGKWVGDHPRKTNRWTR